MINKALLLLLLISLTFNSNLRSQNISKESLNALVKESQEIELLLKKESIAAKEKQNNLVTKYKDVQFSLDDFAKYFVKGRNSFPKKSVIISLFSFN